MGPGHPGILALYLLRAFCPIEVLHRKSVSEPYAGAFAHGSAKFVCGIVGGKIEGKVLARAVRKGNGQPDAEIGRRHLPVSAHNAYKPFRTPLVALCGALVKGDAHDARHMFRRVVVRDDDIHVSAQIQPDQPVGNAPQPMVEMKIFRTKRLVLRGVFC